MPPADPFRLYRLARAAAAWRGWSVEALRAPGSCARRIRARQAVWWRMREEAPDASWAAIGRVLCGEARQARAGWAAHRARVIAELGPGAAGPPGPDGAGPRSLGTRPGASRSEGDGARLAASAAHARWRAAQAEARERALVRAVAAVPVLGAVAVAEGALR